MPKAARLTDATAHGAPLAAGPGSANVRIGSRPAWRALPAGPLQAALESASAAANGLTSAAMLNPASAGPQLAKLQASLSQAGVAAAEQGNANGQSAATSAVSGLTSTHAALATAWAAATALPGGEPGASQAFTRGLQAAVAAAAGAAFAAIGGAADLHTCPTPCPAGPHGPGVVTRGSGTVRINGLPAARQGDKVVEACGGSDPISAGCATVSIGD